MRFVKIPGTALGLLLLCLPVSMFVTIMTAPFWWWFEESTGIESYGHSGPDDWCYYTVYGLAVAISALVWLRAGSATGVDTRRDNTPDA